VPAVGSTYLISGPGGRVVIHTYGMRDISAAFSAMGGMAPVGSLKLKSTYTKAIRGAAAPIAVTARSLARNTSGAYAGSIKIGGGRSGAVLRATDAGAGPIEFANPGAWASVPAHTRGGSQVSAYARQMNLPGSGGQALFPAIEQHLDEVALATEVAVTGAFQALVDSNPQTLDQ